MKTEELERLIVDASDGALTNDQLIELEKNLQNHPDLMKDYLAIMNLPDISNIYRSEKEVYHLNHTSSIRKIKQGIRDLPGSTESFEMITLKWFRKYALAASIAILAITSVFSMMQSQNSETDSELIVEEYFYPADESSTESYVLYLEEITED